MWIRLLPLMIALPACIFVFEDDEVPDGPTAMPLLPDGTHPSMIVGFEPLSAETQRVVDEKWDDAMAAGMQVARIQIDWADLDDGGVIDLEPLRDQLATFQDQGLKPFVSIYAGDSEDLVVPDDLADPASATGLVNGVTMDDPLITERYAAVLDQAIPLIVDHGGWVLSIANEAESYVEAYPAQAERLTAFYETAVDHAHSVDPDLAVTVTLTSSILDGPSDYHDAVVRAVDVVTYNYYCLRFEAAQFAVRTPIRATLQDDIDHLLDAAANKEVIFQEFGCPAGFSDRPTVLGASPERQREYFEVGFSRIHSEPRIRAVYVFQLVDWSFELFDLLYGDLGAEGKLPPGVCGEFRRVVDHNRLPYH